ncbi:MAG TPA: hypothetical protein VH352_18500 [Pseudonocardiaceae bacterium]|nr:hypothetical protein [Pseudonocardiaceae bacterium]
MHDGGGGYSGGHDGGHFSGGHHHGGSHHHNERGHHESSLPADDGRRPARRTNSNYRHFGTVLFLAALAAILLTVLIHR